MVRYNWSLFAGLLAASVVVTILVSLWLGQWLVLGVLLLLPFAFPRRQRPTRPRAPSCTTCGYEAADASQTYCPRHGTRLQ
jgi:hypothetical protein